MIKAKGALALMPLVERKFPDAAPARSIADAYVVRDSLLAAQPTQGVVTVEPVAAATRNRCCEVVTLMTGAFLPLENRMPTSVWTAQ